MPAMYRFELSNGEPPALQSRPQFGRSQRGFKIKVTCGLIAILILIFVYRAFSSEETPKVSTTPMYEKGLVPNETLVKGTPNFESSPPLCENSLVLNKTSVDRIRDEVPHTWCSNGTMHLPISQGVTKTLDTSNTSANFSPVDITNTSASAVTSSPVDTTQATSEIRDEDYQDTLDSQPLVDPFDFQCGRRNIEYPNFVEVPGINTYFGEFPWMLGLFFYYGNDSIPRERWPSFYRCGASLIGPDIALTAAHCLRTDWNYSVQAGDWYNRGVHPEEFLPVQTSQVVDVRIHSKFSNTSLENNIALLKLSPRLEYNLHISPICLPDFNITVNSNDCMLVGWGKNGKDVRAYNRYLRRVDFSLIDHEVCQRQIQKPEVDLLYYELPYGMTCANTNNTVSNINSCKGDGGGPLMCRLVNDPDTLVQVGINSWSINCTSAYPHVFTDVEYYRDWIDENIAELLG